MMTSSLLQVPAVGNIGQRCSFWLPGYSFEGGRLVLTCLDKYSASSSISHPSCQKEKSRDRKNTDGVPLPLDVLPQLFSFPRWQPRPIIYINGKIKSGYPSACSTRIMLALHGISTADWLDFALGKSWEMQPFPTMIRSIPQSHARTAPTLVRRSRLDVLARMLGGSLRYSKPTVLNDNMMLQHPSRKDHGRVGARLLLHAVTDSAGRGDERNDELQADVTGSPTTVDMLLYSVKCQYQPPTGGLSAY